MILLASMMGVSVLVSACDGARSAGGVNDDM